MVEPPPEQKVLPGLATMLSSPVSMVQFWISQWLPPMSIPSVFGEMFDVGDVGLKIVIPSIVTLFEPLSAPGDEHEVVTVAREQLRELEPDPARRAGDQSGAGHARW